MLSASQLLTLVDLLHIMFYCLACIPSADRVSARIKIKVYKTVMRVVTCGLETVEEVVEIKMLKWPVSRASTFRNEYDFRCFGDKTREARLVWKCPEEGW